MHVRTRELGTLPLSTPTWAARGVFCFMFCFGEPSSVLRKCCRKQWELTPSSASVPLKKGLGLSGRREEGGRKGWGLSAWVCHGHVGGCLHAHTQAQSRLLIENLFLYTLQCCLLQVKSPAFEGNSKEQ